MAESRRSPRERTMLGARIVFNNSMSTLDCRIRNISPEGARIMLGDHCAIPQIFEFHVPQRDETFHARVIWRHDNEAGIEFVNARQALSDPADALARIKALERENSTLRKRVVELQARLDQYQEAGI